MQDLEVSVNMTTELRELKIILENQIKINEKLKEIKNILKDENNQFFTEEYHELVKLKEKIDVLIEDLKIMLNFSEKVSFT